MTLSHDEALLLAFRVELDENAPPTIALRRTTRMEKEES
jgi:hypothetical protein